MKDGGPAFPLPQQSVVPSGKGGTITLRDVSPVALSSIGEGMSLRDYFAGQYVIGALASFPTSEVNFDANTMAALAYEFADAMLAVRAVKP